MRPILRRTEAATSFPVTVAQVQAQSRIDGETTYIQSLIAAATASVEESSGKALMEQTWEMKVSGPDDGVIEIPKTPVLELVSITYLNAALVSTALDVDDFALLGDEDRAWIEPLEGVSWPSTVVRADAITITFTAGFEDAESVPANLKQAILMMVGHLYQNREAVGDASQGGFVAVPMGVEYLVGLSRRGWVA